MSDKSCPNCGYCDKCGRGRGYQPAPNWPYPQTWWISQPQYTTPHNPYNVKFYGGSSAGTSPNQSI